MRTRFGTARRRRQHSRLWLCPLSRTPHHRRLLSPCGLSPALAVAAAAPQHPAADKTIATTIGGSGLLPITARLPAPGWALCRETARRWIINTASTGGKLLHLKDELTSLLFLVDTGASRSLIPHHSTAPASGPHLITADGQPISAWGTRKQTLQIGSFHFSFPFVLAAVAFPILSNDFLAAHHLLVDPDQPAVIHRPSGRLLPLSPPSSTSPTLHSLPDSSSSLQQLLHSFPTVFSSDLRNLSPHHGVQHHIQTAGPPVFSKARRLDPLRLQQAKAEFSKLEAAGIIRRSNSPWSSPLHLVPKPDGSWRPCGDYRRLNLATTPDCYPFPNLQVLDKKN